MRKVILNISKLGLTAGDAINIKLVDTIGNILIAPSGYSFNQNIIFSTPLFEIDLLENEFIPTINNYKLTLPNTLHFTFRVPKSLDVVAIPHDLLSLLNIGCVHGIIDPYTKKIDSDFLMKLNLYFTGENPHFTPTQKEVSDLYEYYANDIMNTTYTIDVIKMIDTYLSTLKGV